MPTPPANSDVIARFYDAELRPPRGGWRYEVSKHVFPPAGNTSETAVYESLKRWRQNNGTYTSDENLRREMWAYWVKREPDRTTRWGPARQWDSRAGWKEKKGAAMWIGLHERAAAVVRVGSVDPNAERGYLNDMTRRIHCDECKMHWIGLVRQHPPDFATPDAYFAWTVARHNDVSRRLGKEQWTVERARKEYV